MLDPGRSVREALAGPSWKPSPRFAYLASGAGAAVAGLLFLIGGIFFGQARFGFTLAGAVLLMVAIPLPWLGARPRIRGSPAAPGPGRSARKPSWRGCTTWA